MTCISRLPRKRRAKSEAVTLATYCAAINHAARHRDPRRELIALSLQTLVYFADVRQLVPPFCGAGPRLNELENLGFHFGIDGDRANGLEERGQVVHELAGGDLGQEMRPAILHACVCKLYRETGVRAALVVGSEQKMQNAKGACLATYVEGAELGVGVSVADALL